MCETTFESILERDGLFPTYEAQHDLAVMLMRMRAWAEWGMERAPDQEQEVYTNIVFLVNDIGLQLTELHKDW